MNKCAIPRKDGIVRIGILCDTCAHQAGKILAGREQSFWMEPYSGPRICEGCTDITANETEEMYNV